MTNSAPIAPANAATERLIERALNRSGGTPLNEGNAVELLIDARANFDAWLAAIRSAKHCVLFENYIFRNDEIGREFLDALRERAAAGVRVCVIRDWLGCLGNSRARFWNPLIAAGGHVRAYNPPKLESPTGWFGRDHRKCLIVDGELGFISGVCVSAKWLGNPSKGIDPWRDTGIALRGPGCEGLVSAFAESWAALGTPLDEVASAHTLQRAGDVALRVIATLPSSAGVFRTDQIIAALARKTLWITDAYFIGVSPYVQALCAAAADGVDVRLLVPGTSDLKVVASMSQAGYRPLLEGGVRVFEWNGSMLHAKTAVADGLWARVGSSNLNVSSWFANCELDVAVEDVGFAQTMAKQYETDLCNATEIVLSKRNRVARSNPQPRPRSAPGGKGSSSRAAAGTLRLINTIGAALTNRRVLGTAEVSILPGAAIVLTILAGVAVLWPAVIAWPIALILVWFVIGLLMRYSRVRRKATSVPGTDTLT
jgi:cardiolipin synthase A/B